MESHVFGDELHRAYPPAVREAILAKLTRASKNAADTYREDHGWNHHLFTLASFRFACFETEKMIGAGLPGHIKRVHRPSWMDYKLQVNGFKTAFHRVGGAGDPIETCFPTSPGGPGHMARENVVQMELGLEYTTFQQVPKNVVVAYMSSPEEGLCAVYLCVPDGTTKSGQVNHWAYTELLWKRADDLDDVPPVSSFPPPAPDTDPDLWIRDGVIDESEEDESA